MQISAAWDGGRLRQRWRAGKAPSPSRTTRLPGSGHLISPRSREDFGREEGAHADAQRGLAGEGSLALPRSALGRPHGERANECPKRLLRDGLSRVLAATFVLTGDTEGGYATHTSTHAQQWNACLSPP